MSTFSAHPERRTSLGGRGLIGSAGRIAVILGVAAAISGISLRSPQLALVCAAAPGLALLVPRLRGRILWASFVSVLGGLAVLGYGFANIAVFPSAPVPLVDAMLVAAFIGLVATGARWPSPRLPFSIAALLFGFATLRWAVDYRTWGSFASRDYTTYVELSALFVGYWLMERVGLERWIRAISWISVAVVCYCLLQFYDGAFDAVNIIVGIQRPVLLLGHATGVASVSAFFFFALFRPFGQKSFILAALAIAPLLLFQSRGLYIALPLAVLVLMLMRAQTTGLRGVFAAAAVAVVVAGIVLTIQPSGRFGSTSPALLREQLLTLVGGTGVGDGSLNARTEWFSDTIARVRAHPGGLVYGLGLGPDLAGGFSADSTILVRKPHDDFLEVFARMGIVGLSIFLALLISSVKYLVDGMRRGASSTHRLFQQWVLANTVIYLFVSGTQPLLAYPYGTIPLFGILGAGLALTHSRRSSPNVA